MLRTQRLADVPPTVFSPLLKVELRTQQSKRSHYGSESCLSTRKPQAASDSNALKRTSPQGGYPNYCERNCYKKEKKIVFLYILVLHFAWIISMLWPISLHALDLNRNLRDGFLWMQRQGFAHAAGSWTHARRKMSKKQRGFKKGAEKQTHFQRLLRCTDGCSCSCYETFAPHCDKTDASFAFFIYLFFLRTYADRKPGAKPGKLSPCQFTPTNLYQFWQGDSRN